jgi:hypothetical protein
MVQVQLNLTVPKDLWEQLNTDARKMNMSTHELVRQFIKLGLVAVMCETSETETLGIMDENGVFKALTILSPLQQKLREVDERSQHHAGQDEFNI